MRFALRCVCHPLPSTLILHATNATGTEGLGAGNCSRIRCHRGRVRANSRRSGVNGSRIRPVFEGIAPSCTGRTHAPRCGRWPPLCIALPYVATPPAIWAMQDNVWQRKATHCNEWQRIRQARRPLFRRPCRGWCLYFQEQRGRPLLDPSLSTPDSFLAFHHTHPLSPHTCVVVK
jgi:hypothetical protein